MEPDYYAEVQKEIITSTNRELMFYKKIPLLNYTYPINEYIIGQSRRISSSEFYNKTNMENMDDYKNRLEEYVYQKEWKKLRIIHKKHKIRQYIDSLEYESKKKTDVQKNKEYIFDEVCRGIEDKKIKKNIEIEYDPKAMKITKISCIVSENGMYSVDFS